MNVPLEFRRAAVDDLADVIAILDDAAAWLASRGIEQWPAAFDPRWILPDLQAGETWLIATAGLSIGTLTLGWADPLWNDDARAGYLHRFARRRDAPKLGEAVFPWVSEQVKSRERNLIRLDCVATNQALRAYYEQEGFRHCGDARVGGPPGDRSETGPQTLVSLYERTLHG